ncbi:MAG: 4-(cytidine 5'-diphospho)-2-C-methyl-D-erythritol kinase [Lentisphaeria bacterium]|nr:4-(cytidine 5'-diphospho)-2-C-methyl-D-erythritol kinase [Candidatus Neomarinimicrobiota bacterium]MCF7842752.1 4-(cytidine 5'-diphospho)-2-C-methyl-D-erythritol kinase [Lentisphaeria bacterium]
MPSFQSFSIEAHCKINLALQILGRRPDGYHELDTVFQELAFGDTLHFEPQERFELEMTGVNFDDGGDNIIQRAHTLFSEKTEKEIGCRVTLEKRVPAGSGLGGGSADGAAMLKALNQISGLALPDEQLIDMAVQLGADVPFFIRGGVQHGRGVGERLEPLKLTFHHPVLLVIPPVQVSTKQAFEGLKLKLTDQQVPVTFGRLLTKDDVKQLFENHFEPSVFHTYPQIGAIKRDLQTQGAWFASLSGSGSTVYGVFEDRKLAEAAQFYFQQQDEANTVVLTLPAK